MHPYAAADRPRLDIAGDLASKAILFGLSSAVLLVTAVFGWIPFAFDLSALIGVVAIVYGIRGIRHRRGARTTVLAVLDAALGLLPLAAYVLLVVAFTFAPGD
jgi:hypothetical protein